MSPVPSRYIRAVYLLPGVKCGSEAERERGYFASSGKKRRIVVDHVVLYRCFTVVSWVMRYCTAVLLMQVEVMRSKKICIVVLFVLLFILTWYTNLATRKTKTKRKSPIQQLVHSSRRGRERVPKLPELSDAP